MGMEETNNLVDDLITEVLLGHKTLKEFSAAISQQLREVASKAIDMAQKCKSGSIVVGENIHVYTKESILEALLGEG